MPPSLVLASSGVAASIPSALIAPFVLLLLLIAAMPLAPQGIEGGPDLVAHTALEYVSFISLIGSLFVVAGGIHLRMRGEATPGENLRFLLLGAVAANLIGTTGASMVLIRPWIRMNKVRMSAYHVAFFIFVVSNCGGALTPVGDPPLFIGYLRGVPFFWLVGQAGIEWLLVIGALLAVFFAVDSHCFRKAAPIVQAESEEPDTFWFEGKRNLLLLAVVVGAVFIPGTIPLLREAVMLATAALSYRLTPKAVHEANAFSFGPIKEVGFLFAGIFLTMMPALGYVAEHGRGFGIEKPMEYYAATGSLSAVLDNAPTYATFFELALASTRDRLPDKFPAGAGLPETTRALLDAAPDLVTALSLGAVFFGAMTYIGNGPNFMVKAIADSRGVKTPGFFGYILRFSVPILLPILLLTGWLCL